MAKNPTAVGTSEAENPTPETRAATTGSTVVVGCKLPNGLIIEPEVKVDDRLIPTGERFVLNGSNTSNVIGGYGITENVPADMFNRWMDANKSFAPVRANLIFVVSSMDAAKGEATDRGEVRSGLESISQVTDRTGGPIVPM